MNKKKQFKACDEIYPDMLLSYVCYCVISNQISIASFDYFKSMIDLSLN